MKNIHLFIGKSVVEYAQHGMSLNFMGKSSFCGTQKVGYSGQAGTDGLDIACNRNLKDWIATFVHETCHLDQAIERPRWFKKMEERCDDFFGWCDYPNDDPTILRTTRYIQELEHDCELRAIKKIVDNKLEIDLDRYIRQANCYILGYMLTLQNDKWPSKIYEIESNLKLMPSKLMSLRELQKPDKELLAKMEVPK